MSKNCPFCSLGDRVIKENELAVVFLSNPRKMPGHFLVSPKRHVEQPWKLTMDEQCAIFKLIATAQKCLTKNFSKGVDVRQNYRPFLPQGRLKVDHVHYHVMPRNIEDELYQRVEQYETALFTDLTETEHAEMSRLLLS